MKIIASIIVLLIVNSSFAHTCFISSSAYMQPETPNLTVYLDDMILVGKDETAQSSMQELARAISDKSCSFRKLKCEKSSPSLLQLWTNTSILAEDGEGSAFELPIIKTPTTLEKIFTKKGLLAQDQSLNFYIKSGICEEGKIDTPKSVNQNQRSSNKDLPNSSKRDPKNSHATQQ